MLVSNSQTPATDDESNGFVIVNGKKKQAITDKITPTSTNNLENSNQSKSKNSTLDSSNNFTPTNPQPQQQQQQQIPKKNLKNTNRIQEQDSNDALKSSPSVYHNRGKQLEHKKTRLILLFLKILKK